jgi:hypothetical protein
MGALVVNKKEKKLQKNNLKINNKLYIITYIYISWDGGLLDLPNYPNLYIGF